MKLEHVRQPVSVAGLSDVASLGEKAAELHKTWVAKLRRMSGEEPSFPNERSANVIYLGTEVVAFQILWRYFDDAKIKAAFAQWVNDSRPKTIPEPSDGRGQKTIDWRKKLRDLGVMRLMHFSTVAGMRIRCLEAAERYAGWESRHWSAARKRALRNFRSLLSFLPENELPLHAFTKGGRAKI